MDCIRPFISPFIGIVKFIWPYCLTHVNYLLKLQENGVSLEKALNELKNERDDVQKKVDDAEANPNELMKRNDQVNRWLQNVTAMEGEVVEILRQVDQQTNRRCLGGCCPENCWSSYKVGGSVVQKIASLDELRKKGGFEEVAYKLPPPLVQREPVDSTVGMESMFEKVWRLLAEDEVRIMGLYGYGGVGKTTLLKQINNEFLKTTTTTTTTTTSSNNLNGFDVVILVVVSKALNIDTIQKEIGKRLGLSSPDRTNIFNALSKKNFVLLLDDLWERVDLQSIGIPSSLSLENKKSKIVFTTRSETVCEHMEANEKLKVECLPWNKALSLFQEKVGERALNSFPRARKLAKVVAEKCGGLPLALITIGRAMSTKKTLQEWNHAITTTLRRTASEFPGMGEPVFHVLKLSYDSLGNDTIKSCFLYCALFPEDKSIDIQKLLDYWIGEGLISLSDFNHIDEARNYGYDVIGDLKGACLLESGEDEETEVKMHDVIRDMALWITRECGSSKSDKLLIVNAFDDDGTSERLWYNAERICLMPFQIYGLDLRNYPNTYQTEVVVPTLKSPNLLTLINCNWGRFPELPQNFFEYMPNLRVLDLSLHRMKTFPTSITGLLELRYLSLSFTYIEEVPKLGKLVKLKYLNLSYMIYLKKIPKGVIGSLLELRVLNLCQCSGVDNWDLEEVYKLKHLNDLEITIKTQHNLNKLLSNKNLQMCTRRLILKEANMVMGIEQQQHLGSSCFQNLIEIEFLFCNGLKDLTWVGYVPKLKKLQVSYCREVEEIVVDDDFGGGGGGDETILRKMRKVNIFKSLVILQLFGLPKLKSICMNALAFPWLESMKVSKCPELKKLPLDSGSNVNNTLRRIEGGPKWWSELQWDEDNNNNNNELLKSKFLPYFVEDVFYDVFLSIHGNPLF